MRHEEEVPAQQTLEELPLDALQKMHRELQERIALLDADLNKGIGHTAGIEDAALRHIGTEVGREVTQELVELRGKEEAVREILAAHKLNPDDSLAQ